MSHDYSDTDGVHIYHSDSEPTHIIHRPLPVSGRAPMRQHIRPIRIGIPGATPGMPPVRLVRTSEHQTPGQHRRKDPPMPTRWERASDWVRDKGLWLLVPVLLLAFVVFCIANLLDVLSRT